MKETPGGGAWFRIRIEFSITLATAGLPFARHGTPFRTLAAIPRCLRIRRLPTGLMPDQSTSSDGGSLPRVNFAGRPAGRLLAEMPMSPAVGVKKFSSSARKPWR